MRLRNRFAVILIYLAIIATMLSIAMLRLRAQEEGVGQGAPLATTPPGPVQKLFFSLSTHNTWRADERARANRLSRRGSSRF